jgi:hypothetical protein
VAMNLPPFHIGWRSGPGGHHLVCLPWSNGEVVQYISSWVGLFFFLVGGRIGLGYIYS